MNIADAQHALAAMYPCWPLCGPLNMRALGNCGVRTCVGCQSAYGYYVWGECECVCVCVCVCTEWLVGWQWCWLAMALVVVAGRPRALT
jgi:hypothetical protein